MNRPSGAVIVSGFASASAATAQSQDRVALENLCHELQRWLIDDAYSVWWRKGGDPNGGFHESLTQQGQPRMEPRRARLHPRQMYAYQMAAPLGWQGPHQHAVTHALDFFNRCYSRSDGLTATLVACDGTLIDASANLYDQAFSLLGFASAYRALGDETLRARARNHLRAIQTNFANEYGGYRERESSVAPISSNSHMHLLEAALAWMELDDDDCWREEAQRIVHLALTAFVDRSTLQIREYFDARLQLSAHEARPQIEPGHQYEWAWLLMRYAQTSASDELRRQALGMIDSAESRGVDRQRSVAINSVHAHGRWADRGARLWPQTERLKAACCAAELTGQETYWNMARAAATAIHRYLETPLRGLWYDTMEENGRFRDQPAPASSLYHLVCSIAELKRVMAAAG